MVALKKPQAPFFFFNRFPILLCQRSTLGSFGSASSHGLYPVNPGSGIRILGLDMAVKKPVPKSTLGSGIMDQTCGLHPLFNFEPHPYEVEALVLEGKGAQPAEI